MAFAESSVPTVPTVRRFTLDALGVGDVLAIHSNGGSSFLTGFAAILNVRLFRNLLRNRIGGLPNLPLLRQLRFDTLDFFFSMVGRARFSEVA